MRMNRTTLLLLVVAGLVIAVAFAAPALRERFTPTPTPVALASGEAGEAFPALDPAAVRYVALRQVPQPAELIDGSTATPTTDPMAAFLQDEPTPTLLPTSGDDLQEGAPFVVLVKADDGTWAIPEGTFRQEPDPGVDQAFAQGIADTLANTTYTDRFPLEGASAADFGLEPPQLTFVIRTDPADAATEQTIAVGRNNPAGNRTYAFLNGDTSTVYLLPREGVDSVRRYIERPPYNPPPTATPTPFPTANPLSEVQQTATAEARLTPAAPPAAVTVLPGPAPLLDVPAPTPTATATP